MPRTCDIIPGERFQGLFVGVHGSGKTVGAASWPGPIMIYDFDGRVDPVASFYPTRTDIEYKVVGGRKVNRLDAITFKDFCIEMEALQDSCPYATVILDSITSMTMTVVRYQLSFKGKSTGEEGEKSKKGKVLAGGIIVPTWDEFNGECQTVCEIIEVLKVLDANVIVTAHPVAKMEIRGDEGVKTESITAFGYKTPNFVPNYFNEIWNFTREDSDGVGNPPRRFIRTQAGANVLCKTAMPQIIPPRFDFTNRPLYKVFQEFKAKHAQEQLKLRELQEPLDGQNREEAS